MARLQSCGLLRKIITRRVHSTPFLCTPSTAQLLEIPTPCIFLPRMHCWFPVHRHCLFEEIRGRNDAWALNMAEAATPEEKESVLSEKLVLIACLMFPTAKNSAIQNIVRYMSWFILFDTSVDHTELLGADSRATARLVERYLEVIDGNTAVASSDKAGRFLSFFTEVWEILRNEMSPHQYTTFSQCVRALFEASTAQNKLREDGVIPTAAELLEQRRVVSSVASLICLLEYALGIDLRDCTPEIEEVVNDMISFPVEYSRRDFHNLPSTICMSEKVSIQEAGRARVSHVGELGMELADRTVSRT